MGTDYWSRNDSCDAPLILARAEHNDAKRVAKISA
jgi:hypothetical protein